MPPANSLILCVDDDVDDLFFITSIIQKEEPSFQIEVATNGAEALSYLNEARHNGSLPALILLDINMPLVNGKEVLSRMKADPALASIPVVVLTTSNLPSDRLFCAHYGVDMATKPSSVPEMERLLQKLLNRVFHY